MCKIGFDVMTTTTKTKTTINVYALNLIHTIRLFPHSSQYITNQINVKVKQNYSGWTPEITINMLN